ncbi:MAG: leucyl aminopeptidase [Steroidobacteraceae bacterium]
MQFDVWSKGLARLTVDCVVAGVFDEPALAREARELDSAAGGRLKALVARGDFSGRSGETLLVTEVAGIPAGRVLLVGLGPEKGYNRKTWRRACSAAVTALARTRIRSAAFGIDRPSARALDDHAFGRALAEIAGSALYRINDSKTAKKPPAPTLDRIIAGPVRPTGTRVARRALEEGRAVALAMSVQRDLGNLPANLCTPTYLGERARAIAKQYASVRVQVLDEPAIRRLKMGCFLAVTQGSTEPPRFIVLEHRGGRSGEAPVVLVGKGITFDTGGISIKPAAAMDEMKYDMSGAAAVLAAISFAAEARLPLHVVGLVASCENMPGGRAVKPGDVVTSASGQTVEILNTDAEGRLVLSDALHYARRFEPAAVIDMATLTGACVVALGAHHTGVLGNDDALVRELVAAGVRADDRAWQLPLTEEYGDQLKSNFADFANIGGREAGAITAAAFLAKFTQGLKWAHLDIAGTAYVGGTTQKGSTGRPTPLVAEFLAHRARNRGR